MDQILFYFESLRRWLASGAGLPRGGGGRDEAVKQIFRFISLILETQDDCQQVLSSFLVQAAKRESHDC
jgi:hypothetical protein